MIYGSVCSGIEAASVAWHSLGWRAAFLSEIEPFPRAVLAHHYPGVPLHGDFTTIQAGEYEPIELLVGGTPCQSFSVAGLRGGLADDRGNLALQFLKLADRLRPRWVVWENVPGVLSSSGGRDFGSILGGLGELGYGWAYRVLDAQYFGVPQRRRRVFVVGCLGDWRRAAAVLFERHSLSGHPAPRRETGQGVAAGTAPSLTGSGRGVARPGESRGQDPVIPMIMSHDPATTLTAREYKGALPEADLSTVVAHSLRADGFDASEDGTGRGTPLVPVAFDTYNQTVLGDVSQTICSRGDTPGGNAHLVPAVAIPFDTSGDGRGTPLVPVPIQAPGRCDGQGGPGIGEAGDAMYTLSTLKDQHAVAIPFDTTQMTSKANRSNPRAGDPCHPLAAGAHPPAVAFQTSQSGVREVEAHATLDSNNGSRRHNGVVQGMAVRRLTPRECERLQGFPDDYTQVPYRGKPAADGPRYKALGNSMAVPCMSWIGERIALVDSLTDAECAA